MALISNLFNILPNLLGIVGQKKLPDTMYQAHQQASVDVSALSAAPRLSTVQDLKAESLQNLARAILQSFEKPTELDLTVQSGDISFSASRKDSRSPIIVETKARNELQELSGHNFAQQITIDTNKDGGYNVVSQALEAKNDATPKPELKQLTNILELEDALVKAFQIYERVPTLTEVKNLISPAHKEASPLENAA